MTRNIMELIGLDTQGSLWMQSPGKLQERVYSKRKKWKKAAKIDSPGQSSKTQSSKRQDEFLTGKCVRAAFWLHPKCLPWQSYLLTGRAWAHPKHHRNLPLQNLKQTEKLSLLEALRKARFLQKYIKWLFPQL